LYPVPTCSMCLDNYIIKRLVNKVNLHLLQSISITLQESECKYCRADMMTTCLLPGRDMEGLYLPVKIESRR
jgi:hypothetical protein